MSHDTKSASTDLVRWSFTINPAHRGAIEGHLPTRAPMSSSATDRNSS